MVDESIDRENVGMTAQFVDLFSLSLPEIDVKNFQSFFFWKTDVNNFSIDH